MAPAALHPPDDWLSAYGLGTLDDPAAANVSRHLEGCPACRRWVAELPADDFVGRLREAFGAPLNHSERGEPFGGGPGGARWRLPLIGVSGARVVLVGLAIVWSVEPHDPNLVVEVPSNTDLSPVMDRELAAVPIDPRVRTAFINRGIWMIDGVEL